MNNDTIKNMIDNYTKTHFDLSIGTGAAIAAITSPTDTVFTDSKGEALSITMYNKPIDYLVINVETLARNIIAAIDTSIKRKVINDYQDYIHELVVREIMYIDNLIDASIKKGVYFFFPNYDKVYNVYYTRKKKGIPSMQEEIERALGSISYAISLKASKLDINYIVDDYKIPLKGDVLILTHYGHDLLNIRYNKSLKLLESHTGKVLDYKHFNKKYRNSSKLDTSRLPWLEQLVMVCGTETIVSPVRGALKMVVELAERKGWNVNTSKDKVVNDLRTIKELKDFSKFKGVYK